MSKALCRLTTDEARLFLEGVLWPEGPVCPRCKGKNGKPDFEKMAEIVSKCAAYPVVASFRKAYRAHVTKEVARLAVEWKQTRSLAGSLAVQCDNPAYKAIVSLGGAAVPALLKLLETDPGHWFPALHAITGENPVPTESEGKLKEMAKAWTQWAKDNGHTP